MDVLHSPSHLHCHLLANILIKNMTCSLRAGFIWITILKNQFRYLSLRKRKRVPPIYDSMLLTKFQFAIKYGMGFPYSLGSYTCIPAVTHIPYEQTSEIMKQNSYNSLALYLDFMSYAYTLVMDHCVSKTKRRHFFSNFERLRTSRIDLKAMPPPSPLSPIQQPLYWFLQLAFGPSESKWFLQFCI